MLEQCIVFAYLRESISSPFDEAADAALSTNRELTLAPSQVA